ncbi:helix-turn-helix domain-containing protein [Streptomyces sp. NBRC 109706]|uniref:winged helix-turn-helix transcriptional regulator n=1 Tax=Streptomyces sp. NBRC 109706 TaxID=1550035 RepID=UPI0007823702|nr:helix-turn-helix domain-containing protein [Streptomyces sp. NBRC 109706]
MSATDNAVRMPPEPRLALPVSADEHRACPATDVLRRVGDKWSVLVLVCLGDGPLRFHQLHRGIEEISQRMLTRTLRALERDGLVTRTVFPTVPATVEYDLSPLGRTLLAPLSALAHWALTHAPEVAEARARHDAAGGDPAKP